MRVCALARTRSKRRTLVPSPSLSLRCVLYSVNPVLAQLVMFPFVIFLYGLFVLLKRTFGRLRTRPDTFRPRPALQGAAGVKRTDRARAWESPLNIPRFAMSWSWTPWAPGAWFPRPRSAHPDIRGVRTATRVCVHCIVSAEHVRDQGLSSWSHGAMGRYYTPPSRPPPPRPPSHQPWTVDRLAVSNIISIM